MVAQLACLKLVRLPYTQHLHDCRLTLHGFIFQVLQDSLRKHLSLNYVFEKTRYHLNTATWHRLAYSTEQLSSHPSHYHFNISKGAWGNSTGNSMSQEIICKFSSELAFVAWGRPRNPSLPLVQCIRPKERYFSRWERKSQSPLPYPLEKDKNNWMPNNMLFFYDTPNLLSLLVQWYGKLMVLCIPESAFLSGPFLQKKCRTLSWAVWK